MQNSTREQLNISEATLIEHDLITETNRKVRIRKQMTVGISWIIFIMIIPFLIIQQNGFDSNFVFIFGVIIIIWAILGNRFYSDVDPLLSNNKKHRGIGRMGLGNMNFLGRITGDRTKHNDEISVDQSINTASSTFTPFGVFLLIGLFIVVLGFIYY